MSDKVLFTAQKRSIIGKKVKTVRAGANIPANISGNVGDGISLPVTIDRVKFAHLYHKVGDTGLIYLQLEGEKQDRPVLVSELQKDPISSAVLHVVFRQVDLSQKVVAEVPVVVVGESLVKNAIVVTVHDAIKVSALPQDLPERFEINAAELTELGQMITFEQLRYDADKITLDVPAEQLTTPVVMIQEVKEEKEPEPIVEIAAEGEAAAAVPGEEKAPAEGEAKKPEAKKE